MHAKHLKNLQRYLRPLASLACFLPLPTAAQVPATVPALRIDSLTASKNLISMPPPVYPMHAKQLHIKGTVALEANVDTTGRVTSAHALSGPQELQQAAVDALSHTRYKPFLSDGKPSPAIVSTKIVFAMNDEPLSATDESVSHQYFASHERCEALMTAKSSDALTVCLETVELSKRFSPGAELESRAVAYSDAAGLLLLAGRTKEAEALGAEVVPLVAPAGRISQAAATAYMTRAYTRTGDAIGSLADLDESASILKTLKEKETSPVFIKMFQRERTEVLHSKAALLHELGRDTEARQANTEAANP